jgi:glutaredoxin
MMLATRSNQQVKRLLKSIHPNFIYVNQQNHTEKQNREAKKLFESPQVSQLHETVVGTPEALPGTNSLQ